MYKYIVFAFLALISVSYSAPYIVPGTYVWQNQGQCLYPTQVTLTNTNGVVNSFSTATGNPFLVNVTVNSDGTFNGQGALYNQPGWKFYAYTVVTGKIIDGYTLYINYLQRSYPYFGGNTLYYIQTSCSMNERLSANIDTSSLMMMMGGEQ
ncbi:hypothetical protein PPL_02841 [Heterostelium album PN500]|uniref:Uncharacterized protein n=1 Tax=Heterostelium pallidum (strain ATCC 26659 / Pp 5 / PN500) TaxID=670386 RepID=D3B376_HETP5|nr:hypothetical protein PPL_02841 [Heterostelium album PN500]EFA83774.1 hypothetical protein PPL_02841 [Heterostelium album PN500]|eukprot:XP_020435891.1 hypothetical protein PPL_02841 [Heterostelium album PN500]